MDEQTRARRAACTTFLGGDGWVRPPELLASIPPDVYPDSYGEGGAVADLERYVAELLGKPAAVFLPSGTMAQGATLRMHADRRSSRTVLWHPACHLEQHEGQAHARLHGLVGRPVGARHRLIELADLTSVAEPVAALLLELPQRDLGGQLPDWQELARQLDWARDRGAAVHLDGARLWEASAGYGRQPAEIAALFDTVYVSFYKGIGALAGCCVAGPAADVAEVREWRRRLGGTLYGLWPAAASALSLLPERLAEMPARLAHARAIAAALAELPSASDQSRAAELPLISGQSRLAELPRITVLPDPPQTPMLHLLFRCSAETFAGNARRLAEQDGIWTWPEANPTDDPAVLRCELSVGRATCRLAPERVAEILYSLVG